MRNLLWIACALILVSPAMAQVSPTPDTCASGPRAGFDVVSIKESRAVSGGLSLRYTPDGMLMTSPLRLMITYSFNLHDFQLAGGPDWLSSSIWVVDAKNDVPDPDFSKLSQVESQALFARRKHQVRSMLMDRFQLKCHIVAKELPIYELVLAKGGAKLKPTQAEPSAQGSESAHINGLQVHHTAIGVTADRIASLLTNESGRMVVDKTGLTGSYDLTLNWVKDPPAESTATPTGPGLFTALEQQLGLKLVPAKGPVPVLVIDSVEKPSEN